MDQLKLLQDQENITKIHDNGYDRLMVSGLEELAVGQIVMLDSFKDKIGFKKKGRVVDVHGQEFDFAYWPREQDLELNKIYQSARDKFKNKDFDEMTNREKKVFMVNAKTTTLAEMDYINRHQGIDIFSLPPEARRKVEEYISSFLPINEHYEIAFGKIEEYKHKIGDQVIAKNWDTLYIGKLDSRIDTSQVVIDYDCKYKLDDGQWNKIKDSGQVVTLTNYLKHYSMSKLKSLIESGTPVSY